MEPSSTGNIARKKAKGHGPKDGKLEQGDSNLCVVYGWGPIIRIGQEDHKDEVNWGGCAKGRVQLKAQTKRDFDRERHSVPLRHCFQNQTSFGRSFKKSTLQRCTRIFPFA